ncbi:MAG: XTP/dITP diphosphohydrolase [Verrucomicrobiota bacterium]|jgi:XTP/dITP diphosphohydrolase
MDLLLATRNAHKTREFAEILGEEFRMSDLSGLTIAAIEETGRTFAENATLKALAVSQDRHLLVVADDSGLEVDALDGAPGIFSARYAGANATDAQNIEKLLRELAGKRDRSARFRCVIALARNGDLLGTFEGAIEGVIVDLARGGGGFGYDPVFQPEGFDKTFGELPAATKNQISHRARAITQLAQFLQTQRD